jgi:lipid II:glycine glycyltransferase (peptidoglycan interpeptide bridge formation enzyme)
MREISLFEDALPTPLFYRLVDAAQAVGTERMEDRGSYSTTFWFPLGAKPTNIVEECIAKLCDLVQPAAECIGMEWWLGRLQYGESLPFHTDRDRSLRKQTGQIVHPLWSSILYLNRFPSSPTVVLDQILSPDGKSWIPPEAKSGRTLDPIPNHYAVFRGDLRHGVVAGGTPEKTAADSRKTEGLSELRLTLLVNYWDRRPSPPNCRDYNGTIYPSIQYDDGNPVASTATSSRLKDMNDDLPRSSPPQLNENISAPASPQPAAPDRWKAWDTFVEAMPETGFMQSSWWVDFRYACGFENFGITLKEAGDIVAGAVVLRYSYADDHCFYYIQDGPVLPPDPAIAEEAFRVILETIAHHQKTDRCVVSHLRIEPRWLSLPEFVSGFSAVPPLADPYMEARDTRGIDLRPSEGAILAQMKPKGRYNIGVALRHGVSIVEDTSAQGLADFQEIYEETAMRQGMNPKPPDYFQTLLSLCSPVRRGSLFFAEYQGIRLATALVVYFGRIATYFYGGSRHIHRNLMAPYLLHFEIMRKAKALGHEWYDMWGIAPTNDPDHSWHNFSVFKAKFGGAELHLVPTLDYVFDCAAYAHYKATEGNTGLVQA